MRATLNPARGGSKRSANQLHEEARVAERPTWSWQATTLESIRGKPFPMQSRLAEYDPLHPNREESARIITVRNVEFGKTYPESAFWRDADDRTAVIDLVDGQSRPPKVRQAEAKIVVSNPVQVAPVEDYSGILAAGGLTLSVTVLIVGLVSWFRRG